MRMTTCRSSEGRGMRDGGRGNGTPESVRGAVPTSPIPRPSSPAFPTSHPIVQKQRPAPSAASVGAGYHELAGSRFMLVRAVRSRQRGRLIRVTATVAIAVAAISQTLVGQTPASALPKTHTVKRGDTLWDISKTYLGDAFLWPEIYRLNTDIIEDPHWIYPSEVLKLPGPQAKVVAVVPPSAAPAAAPKPVAPVPVVAQAPARDTATPPAVAPAKSSVRVGEYSAAPWVEGRKGPSGSGYIVHAVDIPGIASVDQSRLHLYDKVFVSPPAGAGPGRQVYLAYRLGPLIEDLGQILIPTGLIEVAKTAPEGEASVGRVVKMY